MIPCGYLCVCVSLSDGVPLFIFRPQAEGERSCTDTYTRTPYRFENDASHEYIIITIVIIITVAVVITVTLVRHSYECVSALRFRENETSEIPAIRSYILLPRRQRRNLIYPSRGCQLGGRFGTSRFLVYSYCILLLLGTFGTMSSRRRTRTVNASK